MKHQIALLLLSMIAIPGLVQCGGAPGTQFDLKDPSDKREFFCTLALSQNTPELEPLKKACESELGEAVIDAAIEQAEKFITEAATRSANRCAE